jgi:hypothetical protein
MAKDETKETKDVIVSEDSEAYVGKLSIKALGCDPRLPRDVKQQLLCRIWGKAGSLKVGENRTTGDVWTALQGRFEGVNVQEGSDDYGKQLASGKLFLPGGIQDTIEAALHEIENTSGGTESAAIIFALEIYSVTANNPIGYSYLAKNLVPNQKQDELAELRKAVETKAGKVKALPAPKK